MCVNRNNKLLIFYKMRSITIEQASFNGGFPNQFYIALAKVTNTTMHQFGASARSALCKICLLEQQRFISTCCSFQSNAQACCATTNHQYIPYYIFVELLYLAGSFKKHDDEMSDLEMEKTCVELIVSTGAL